MNKKQLKQIEKIPLGDDDIKKILGNDTLILTYPELEKYNNIDMLLPYNKSFVILLYLDSPNSGHWICINKINDTIEFFDPYGGSPDTQRKWIPDTTRKILGQGRPFLTDLLDSSDYKVNYNHIKYQGNGDDINTCGRHVCNRLLMLKDDLNLDDYFKLMKGLKIKTGLSYDDIVTQLIPIK